MNNQLQIFNNPKFGQIRTQEVNGKIYFASSDVAKSLGYKNPQEAIRDHCKGVAKRSVVVNSGLGEQIVEMNFIPEGDIYRLAANSELPGAEEFESWVFDDILPSIRKHGMYAKDELLDNPDLMIEVLQQLKREREEKKLLQTENKLLSGQTLTWADRKILEAIVKAYGSHIDRTKINESVNGYVEAWHQFKKELLYAHGINLTSRVTIQHNNTGKKPKTMAVIDVQ